MKLIIPLLSVLLSFSIGSYAKDITDAVVVERTKELRDISLGMHVSELPAKRYKDFTCGGPAKVPKKLKSLSEFLECSIDAHNIYQVWLKYDHSDNQWSEVGERFSGTKISGHPVNLSVLIDNEGVIQGLQAYTDPNASPFSKRQAYLLSANIKKRYGSSQWECIDETEADQGKHKAIGPVYIDQVCSKTIDDKRIIVKSKFYRSSDDPIEKGITNSSSLVIISLKILPFQS